MDKPHEYENDKEVNETVSEALIGLRAALKAKHKFDDLQATAVTGYSLLRTGIEITIRGLGFDNSKERADSLYQRATELIHNDLYPSNSKK